MKKIGGSSSSIPIMNIPVDNTLPGGKLKRSKKKSYKSELITTKKKNQNQI
jgi:hypothetical protein